MATNPRLDKPIWITLYRNIQKRIELEKKLAAARKQSSPDATALENELTDIRAVISNLDKQLHTLLRTGFMALRSGESFHDISKTSGDVALVKGVANRWQSLKEQQQLTNELLAQWPTHPEQESVWQMFLDNNWEAIDYLMMPVYASPERVRRCLAKGESTVHLAGAFLQAVAPDTLRAKLQQQRQARQIVLAYPLLEGSTDAERANSIRQCRTLFNRELAAMAITIQAMRRGILQRDGIPDAAEQAAAIGNDAFLRIQEYLWNGTFVCTTETFIDSVLATANQFSKFGVKETVRDHQKHGTADALDPYQDLPAELTGAQLVQGAEFVARYWPQLLLWLADLNAIGTQRRIIALKEYALAVSPAQKGELAESSFINWKSGGAYQSAEYNAYQGRVRDGGYKAVELFNERFSGSANGLALIGDKQKTDALLVGRIRAAGRQQQMILAFNPALRETMLSVEDVSDDVWLQCLLETIHITQEHLLFNLH